VVSTFIRWPIAWFYFAIFLATWSLIPIYDVCLLSRAFVYLELYPRFQDLEVQNMKNLRPK
jgi:hypothetical protein